MSECCKNPSFPTNFQGRSNGKELVRPKFEECEKIDDGKSCEARQALLQLGGGGGVWGAL